MFSFTRFEVTFDDLPDLRAVLIPVVVGIPHDPALQSQIDSTGEDYTHGILKAGLQQRRDLVRPPLLTLEVEGVVVRGTKSWPKSTLDGKREGQSEQFRARGLLREVQHRVPPSVMIDRHLPSEGGRDVPVTVSLFNLGVSPSPVG
jgi:hypothetical protein